MRRHWKKIVLGLLVLFLIVRVVDFTTTTPEELRISEETTFLTGPLDQDGQVDYGAAINARNSKGVTPQNNAAAAFVQVIGPDFIAEEYRQEFFAKLGIPIPPAKGDYFLGLEEFAEKVAPQNQKEYYDKLCKQYNDCDFDNKKLWSRKKSPKLAAWVDHNKISLDKMVIALQRPKWYLPVVAYSTDSDYPRPLKTVGYIQFMNSILRGFLRRIELAIQENRVDDTYTDLIACHRLARFVSQDYGGFTAILVGNAFESITHSSHIQLLNSGQIKLAQLAKYQQALALLPPFDSASQNYSSDERLIVLSEILGLANGMAIEDAGIAHLFKEPNQIEGSGLPAIRPFLGSIDWNIVSKRINQSFDEWSAILSRQHYQDYQRASAAQQATEQQRRVSCQKSRIALGLHFAFGSKKTFQDTVSEIFANGYLASFSKGGSQIAEVEFHRITRMRLMQIAMALEQYRLRTGKFPVKLVELMPQEMKTIPLDFYSEQPFFYNSVPEENSYLLYSVGPNLKDEKGWDPSRDFPEDDPEDDDPEDDAKDNPEDADLDGEEFDEEDVDEEDVDEEDVDEEDVDEEEFFEEEFKASDDISIRIQLQKK